MEKRKSTRVTDETIIIGENILRLRRLRGLSQGEVAEAIDTSFQQVQKYEKGQNRIPAERLHRLKLFFDVPYAAFFDGLSGPKTIVQSDAQHMAAVLSAQIAQNPDPQWSQKLFRAVMILAS